MDAFPCLGSSAQLDVLDIVEVDGDIFELEEPEGREYLVKDAGAGAIAVRIVIGDADQVATFETLELFRKHEGFFFKTLVRWPRSGQL